MNKYLNIIWIPAKIIYKSIFIFYPTKQYKVVLNSLNFLLTERVEWFKKNKTISNFKTGKESDSTPRQTNEEALKNSELRYRRLFEAAQDAILILDGKNGHIIDANPFVQSLLGYSLNELMGKKLLGN